MRSRAYQVEDVSAFVASAQNQKPDGLVELINKKGREVTVRDVQRSSRPCSTADAAVATLEHLLQAGLACCIDRPGNGKGGIPTVKTDKKGTMGWRICFRSKPRLGG
ncbi:MAG: hypothetical protein VX346_25150 [Planctomycetota bacterium]|nr:hypothetical protein [Planctomycetota bacterium]